MPVQQHVLNWLYSVLTSEYHDVNRTYNDVAHALTRYPSLAPRTDVHTFSNGTSALLLHLSGTIPVNFRGNTYRFPLSIWVPHAYPRKPPLIYVTPTENMMIRPGQHIDPQGQVYHPYLVGWAEFWDKSTLHDFLTILSDVFAKEPPVISRQQSRQTQSPQPVQVPPPVPPLPPEVASHEQQRPPPPPPKTASQEPQGISSLQFNRDNGPHPPSKSPPRSRTSRYDSAPPLPTEAGMRSPNETSTQTLSHRRYQSNTPQNPPYSHITPILSTGSPSQLHGPPQNAPPLFHTRLPPLNNPPGQYQQYQHPPAMQPPQSWNESARPAPVQPAPTPPDLLDGPLTLELPDQSTMPPPPIPPNPEKDALLRQLAQTLASLRQRSRQQNESSMAGLQAQRSAIFSVMPTLQSEMGQLAQLSNVLTSNTAILHDALRKADGVIEGSRSHPAPDIDELLVAPTVVANQLYMLVAEERALGDAIFMLGRAVERGRISPAVFAKMTRSLAREWYLKKALVRKIGLGMGLAS